MIATRDTSYLDVLQMVKPLFFEVSPQFDAKKKLDSQKYRLLSSCEIAVERALQVRGWGW